MKNLFLDNPLAVDLNHILACTKSLWENARGKKIFITGGTGFFGCWFLESFIWANERLKLNASAQVLTRDYETFKNKAPHLANNPAVKFLSGDVRDFIFPDGEFDYIIHAASTSPVVAVDDPDQIQGLTVIEEGTKHILDFALRCHAQAVLLTSSGSVYGQIPHNINKIPETFSLINDFTEGSTKAIWGESKRAAEALGLAYAKSDGLKVKIARCFTFIGPYLPLNVNYAAGNFIQDGLNGGPIKISGDSTVYRSYLYASDLMIWLWTIFFKGESGRVYNVGSEEKISIAELAHAIARNFKDGVEVRIITPAVPGKEPEQYIPETDRARSELGLKQYVNFEDAVKKTISFNLKDN